MKGLRVLAVDDEELALRYLVDLLERNEQIEQVLSAASGEEALRTLNDEADLDGVFLDVEMPGLSGVDLVKVLNNFKSPPPVAFVTAYDEYAVDAFGLAVCDYLMKPVAQSRLDETIRRMVATRDDGEPVNENGSLPRLRARSGASSIIVDRDDVVVLEAAGDYVRAYTDDGSHLVRESISSLTSAWSAVGFIRIHRSYLVRASAISEVRSTEGRRTIIIAGKELPVSRRYSRLLQDHLGGRG